MSLLLAAALSLALANQPAFLVAMAEVKKTEAKKPDTRAAKPAAKSSEEDKTLAEVSKAAGHKVVPGTRIVLETSKGKVTLIMFDKEAPKTAGNFEKLVKKGFYDGLKFHRVISGFVAQGGDPQGTGEGGPGYEIKFEKNSLKHLPGAIAMARSQSLDSAGSQFFINLAQLDQLNQVYDDKGTATGGYVVFGQVVQGMDVVHKINKTMDRGNGSVAGAQPDKIVKAKIL